MGVRGNYDTELFKGLAQRRPNTWPIIVSLDSICRDSAGMQYMLQE